MKKFILTFFLLLTSTFMLSACQGAQKLDTNTNSNPSVNQSSVPLQNKIRLQSSQGEIIIRLNDTPASQDLLAQLPLKLNFEDYNRTEKITYLPQKLNTAGSPNGYLPKIGDLTYFAPWGNLAFFYRDFSYSNGLISLGTVESGQEILDSLSGEVLIEVLENATEIK